MNQIHDLPDEMRAGHDFDYAAWAPNTTVTMCNVPWNSDYRDVVLFSDQEQMNAYVDYLAGPTVRMTEMVYHRPGKPIRVDVPYGRALRYNYLRATNPAQPLHGGLDIPMNYYYFITDIEHVAPGTTALYLQLDVWSTFIHRTKFGQCFVESGHIGVANENQFNHYGRDYLTIPEGLDVGGEYQISKVYSHSIASARGETTDHTSFGIMVLSTVSLMEDPGTVDAPIMHSANGNTFENLPNGAEAYIFTSLNEFKSFMELYSDKPWITQGIISITVVPGDFVRKYMADTTAKKVNGMLIKELNPGTIRQESVDVAPDWRNKVLEEIPERYRKLKKLLTYPYTVLELTSHTGTPIMIKPEAWDNANGKVVESSHFAQPAPRIQFYPYRYNAGSTSAAETDQYGIVQDGGEFLDMATGIFNLPTFSLVNNGYMSFMASNSAGISYQHQSADWSQQRAQTGNQLAYDQSSAGMGLTQDLSQQGINLAQKQSNLANSTAALSGMASAINGGVSAAGRANPAGVAGAAASAAIGTGISIHQNHQSMVNSTDFQRGSTASTVANQGYMRDSNKSFADFATTGDYQNQIAGIAAKIQDAKLIQPTTSGQVGGDAYLLATYRWGYDLKVKTMQGAALARVGEYFLRYGYQVNRFMFIPNLHCMSIFTYWKLKESYITEGNYPEKFKQTMRGIMEKGVTVWRTPSDIGNTDLGDNRPMEGIAY